MLDLSLLRARLINVRSAADSQEEYDALLERLASEYGFQPETLEETGDTLGPEFAMFEAVTRYEKETGLPDWVEEEEAESGF